MFKRKKETGKFLVNHKEKPYTLEVFDVRDDENGDTQFLMYLEEWIWLPAKDYKPSE